MLSFGKPKTKSVQLERRLTKSLKCDVKLQFIKDGVRRIWIEPKGKDLLLRLDPLFETIDDLAYEALIKFIQIGDESSKAKLIDFLSRAKKTQPQSHHQHPYQSILDELRSQHFPSLAPLKLVRGKEGKKGSQKTIRLASYWAKRKEIRLHPFIEIEGMPDFYLQYLLYHELCHAWLVMSGQAKDGEHHGPDFMTLEKKFPQLHQAIEWEDQGLNIFLEQCKRSRQT